MVENEIGATNFTWAVYSSNLQEVLMRFDDQSKIYKTDRNQFVVCEVSEKLKDGTLLIKQLRVLSGPKEWIPVGFIPEYDGRYLCNLTRKEECGTTVDELFVLSFSNMKWEEMVGNWQVTHWMIVPRQ